MTFKVLLNGKEYIPISININRKISDIGQLRSNRATVVLNNANSIFKFNPSTNKIIDEDNNVIDKDVSITIAKDNVVIFEGYTDLPSLDAQNRRLELIAHDSITYLQNQQAEPKLYLDFKLTDILRDILDGYDIDSNFKDLNLVIDNFRVKEDTTKAKAIETLLKDIGGRLWCTKENKIYFDGGYIYALQNPPKTSIDTLSRSQLTQYNSSLPNDDVDSVRISSESLKKKDELKYIYINADFDTPESTKTFATFDNPIWYLDSFVNIEFDADVGVTLDETTYNNNFLTGNTPKLADKAELKYNGTGHINYIKIKGKEFEINKYIAVKEITSNNQKRKEIKCSLVQSDNWASDLANYYYAQYHNRPIVDCSVADLKRFFSLDYDLDKYVTLYIEKDGISNKMVIEGYTLDVSSNSNNISFNIDLNLKYSSGDSFVPVAVPTTLETENQGLNLDEIDEQVILNTDNISDILSDLSDIASDSKLTPNEKKMLKKEWERIQAEYTTTLTTASNYGLSTTSYTNAYNSLDSYITPLLSNLTTTDDINRSIFNFTFNTYYAQLKNIIDNTSVKANEDMTNKKLSQGTTFELGKGALPDGSDGLYIDSGQLLIGQSKTSTPRLLYDGANLEIVGGTLKLSSTNGEIEFLDSNYRIKDAVTYSGLGFGVLIENLALTDFLPLLLAEDKIQLNYDPTGTSNDQTFSFTFNSALTSVKQPTIRSDFAGNAGSISIEASSVTFSTFIGTYAEIAESYLKLPFSTTGTGKPEGAIWYNPSDDRVYIKRGSTVDRFIMASEF